MMTFRNLDYTPKIPPKPPKLASKRVSRGPKILGGENLKIVECDFPQKLIFGRRPIPLEDCKIWCKSKGQFLHSVSAPWEIRIARGPKSKGKSEKVRVLLKSGSVIATSATISSGLSLLPTNFFWGSTRKFKNSPLPTGGAEGHRVVQAPIYSRQEGPLKVSRG